jgi:hypothetical protein
MSIHDNLLTCPVCIVMCERDNGSTPAKAQSMHTYGTSRAYVHEVSCNVILKHSFNKAIIMHGESFRLFFSRVNYVPVVRAWKWISSALKISTDMIIFWGRAS